jgi:hypothetical protein
VQDRSEFLLGYISLSQLIVVNEEFSESKSVLLNHLLDFLHEGFNLLSTSEVEVGLNVGGFGTRGWSIDCVYKALGIVDEVEILNVILFVTINQNDSLELSVTKVESEASQNLLELLWGDLEVLMFVEVLEEGFGVKSLSLDQKLELLDDTLDEVVVFA